MISSVFKMNTGNGLSLRLSRRQPYLETPNGRTQSIAVGCESFVAEVKRKLGAMSVGRRVRPSKDGFELKETIDPYNARFETEKCDIDANNTWYWDLNH